MMTANKSLPKLFLILTFGIWIFTSVAQADEVVKQNVQVFNDAAELAHVTCQPHDPFKTVSSEQELKSVYEDSIACIEQHITSIKSAYEQAHAALASNPQATAGLDEYYNKWVNSMTALVPQVNEDETTYNLIRYGLYNQTIETWANLAAQIGI
jgi:hypothetical protein